MADKPLIVVFLATGAQGSSVAKSLAASGAFRVRGLTRSTASAKSKALEGEGVEMVEADYTKTEDVARVLKGAYGAYLVTDFWTLFDKETDVGKACIATAKAAGVKHLIWSSLVDTVAQSGGKINVPHFANKGRMEADVIAAGLEYYTFLMPGLYFQNFLDPKLHFTGAGEEGEVLFTLPMKPTAYITAYDTNDTGPAALAIFQNPQEWTGKHVAIAGFHGTAEEYAAIFEEVKKRKAVFKQVPAANEELKHMFDWFSEYTYFGSFDRETGRQCYPGLKTWKEFLEATSWNGP